MIAFWLGLGFVLGILFTVYNNSHNDNEGDRYWR